MPAEIIPFALMAAVSYFMIIRPEAQKQKAHAALVAGLVKDDEIVLKSGLHGVVTRVDAETLGVKVASSTVVTIDKDAVSHKKQAGEGAASS